MTTTGSSSSGSTGATGCQNSGVQTCCAVGAGQIYNDLGCDPGVQTMIGAFVGSVAEDTAISEYFLNDQIDLAHLTNCLVLFVDAATGGVGQGGTAYSYPGTYTSADGTIVDTLACRGMAAAHNGMGIDTNEYTALLNDLVYAMTNQLNENIDVTSTQATADIGAVASVVTSAGFVSSIVSDPNNNGSLFHRLGGFGGLYAFPDGGNTYPDGGFGVNSGLPGVIGGLVDIIETDTTINGYFAVAGAAGRAQRIEECLVRQLCAVGGTVDDGGVSWPCNYSHEDVGLYDAYINGSGGVETQQGLSLAAGTTTEDEITYADGGIQTCRDMLTTHLDVTEVIYFPDAGQPPAGPDGGPAVHVIDISAFDEVVTDLNLAMTNAGISSADIASVDTALGGTCSAIVDAGGGQGCP